MTVATVVYRG